MLSWCAIHHASVMPHLLPRDAIIGAGPDVVEELSGDGAAPAAKHPDFLADDKAFVAGPSLPRGVLEDLFFFAGVIFQLTGLVK